jgi:hypothetical protein
MHSHSGRQGSAGRRENASHLAACIPPTQHLSPSASLTLVGQRGAPRAGAAGWLQLPQLQALMRALHHSPPISSGSRPALGE